MISKVNCMFGGQMSLLVRVVLAAWLLFPGPSSAQVAAVSSALSVQPEVFAAGSRSQALLIIRATSTGVLNLAADQWTFSSAAASQYLFAVGVATVTLNVGVNSSLT